MSDNLEDRIRRIRADIDAIIEKHADDIAKRSPGVPRGVIRNLLTARAPSCPCAQYLETVASLPAEGGDHG